MDAALQDADRLARARAGFGYGVAAYFSWGLVPLYFKAVGRVAPLEVIAHRVVWSVILLGVLIVVVRRSGEALAAVRTARTLLTLSVSGVLIGANWLVFIWAVSAGHVLQCSLGYFISPLVNVVLGMVFLGERLSRAQSVSVALAAGAVVYLASTYGQFPWIAIALAATFGAYALIRKTAKVDALIGLGVETALLAPLAAGYLVFLSVQGVGSFGAVSPRTDLLLLLSGAITAVPLLWFTTAARRLRLATLGLLQYISPTLQFLLAVWLYHEPLTPAHVLAFAGIWTALAIYSVDAGLRARAGGARARAPVVPAPARSDPSTG